MIATRHELVSLRRCTRCTRHSLCLAEHTADRLNCIWRAPGQWNATSDIYSTYGLEPSFPFSLTIRKPPHLVSPRLLLFLNQALLFKITQKGNYMGINVAPLLTFIAVGWHGANGDNWEWYNGLEVGTAAYKKIQRHYAKLMVAQLCRAVLEKYRCPQWVQACLDVLNAFLGSYNEFFAYKVGTRVISAVYQY